jgi:hypothetical protein
MSREETLAGFVVLTAPRSGSTWFLDLLRLATDARVFAELFIPGRKPRSERLMTAGTAAYLDSYFRDVPLFCELDRSWWPTRPVRTFQYLNRIMGQSGTVGFKLMYPNLLNYPEVWAFLVRHHLPVVHLVRLNHLDVYLSSQVRFSTQTVHSLVGEPESPSGPIVLNPDDMLLQMKRSQRNIRLARLLLRCSPVRSLEICYEHLLDGSTEFEAACNFLNLTRQTPCPTSSLRKLVTKSHSELIANYDEVKDCLRGTRFEAFLR